jgi:3-oxoacyl-[acyl-carrier protein] reductase
MEVDLQGRIAIVTGSARGIGRATAEALARNGATVIVSDILREEGEAVAAKLGGRCLFQPCDISDQTQVASLVDLAVKRFGRLDVMVNNAGINAAFDAERVSIDRFLDDTWHRIIDVDLTGAFYCCRAAAAQMVKQRSGSIINVSSVAGVVALRLQIAYVAAKAAIIKLTQAMACEIGPQGVRVNAVCPGSVDATAQRLSTIPEAEGGFSERAKSIAAFIPQGRMGNPTEIANAILFLASDEASYVNGHNFVVDGGWTCGFNRDW